MQPILQSVSLALPEIILGVGSLVLLMVGVFRGDRSIGLVSWLCVGLYLAAGLALLDDPLKATAFDGLYIADPFAAYLKVVLYVAAAASTIVALPHLAALKAARFEYPILILLSVFGLSLMLSANDMLSLYIGLETSALASYVLAAIQRDNGKSTEAGLKYFVLGSLASGVLLYGISLIYGFTGSTNFNVIAQSLSTGTAHVGVTIGLVFILSGLAFKVSAVPFHMWTPDVYEGAPTPVVTFFASAQKVAAMGLLVRMCIGAFGNISDVWQQVVVFAAIASMLFGAVAAVAQTNIKRLLAYSSIANVGFALVGLAAGTQAGIAALLFYMAVYAAMTLGSFLIILNVRDANGKAVENIADLAGLARERPAMAAALAIFMFSLAGIPPMLGFWPKFAVFNAAMAEQLYALAILGVISSVVGAFYYLRVIKTVYFDAPAGNFSTETQVTANVVLFVAALFCSPIGMLAITPLDIATHVAAHALF